MEDVCDRSWLVRFQQERKDAIYDDKENDVPHLRSSTWIIDCYQILKDYIYICTQQINLLELLGKILIEENGRIQFPTSARPESIVQVIIQRTTRVRMNKYI